MDKHDISTLMDKHDISTRMDKHDISTLMDSVCPLKLIYRVCPLKLIYRVCPLKLIYRVCPLKLIYCVCPLKLIYRVCPLKLIYRVCLLKLYTGTPLIIALIVFPEITLYPSIKSTIILLEINFYVFFFHRLINNLCKITVTTVGLDYSFFLDRTRTGNHLIWFETYSTLMDKHIKTNT
jgi:hypothetical protein